MKKWLLGVGCAFTLAAGTYVYSSGVVGGSSGESAKSDVIQVVETQFNRVALIEEDEIGDFADLETNENVTVEFQLRTKIQSGS